MRRRSARARSAGGSSAAPQSRQSRPWGAASATRARIVSTAARTWTASARSRATPPTSDLCVMSRREDLDRDRKPDRIRRRPPPPRHRLRCAYAPPGSHRQRGLLFASGSVSQSLPSASARSITARAAAASGANSSGTEGGVSISARWLVAVADQVHEGHHRLTRRVVHRHATALEQAAGLPRRWGCRRPSWRSEADRGRICTLSTTACAASVLEAIPVGQFSARIASMPGSPSRMLRASA